MLNTRADAEKNLKDGRREKLQQRAYANFSPKGLQPFLGLFFVHEQTEIKSMVIQQQNFQILVWDKEEKKIVVSEPMEKVFWILNYTKY